MCACTYFHLFDLYLNLLNIVLCFPSSQVYLFDPLCSAPVSLLFELVYFVFQ